MKPIQEILSRLRWDENLSRDKFKIAYYDRFEKDLVVVSFGEIRFSADDHFSFYVVDESGVTHSIPFHRVIKAVQQRSE